MGRAFLLPAYPPVPAAYPLPQTAASEAALPLKAFPPEVPVLRSGDDSPPRSATPGTCGQTRTKVFGGWRGYGGGRAPFPKGSLPPPPLSLAFPQPGQHCSRAGQQFFRMAGGEAETQQGLPARYGGPAGPQHQHPALGQTAARRRQRASSPTGTDKMCASPMTGSPRVPSGPDGKRPHARPAYAVAPQGAADPPPAPACRPHGRAAGPCYA